MLTIKMLCSARSTTKGSLMKSEKHEFLYTYARAAFDDELQRFRNIEDKSARYLSLRRPGVSQGSWIASFLSEVGEST
ncbi:hypothetical protein [Oceanimonas baumannii]|uniref:hypothetical protein n=1 Tax=Oceanimonas baumannii TaxID=129578 RepID=UPI0014170675|nr:hypothetical protein [Oceanimonas baumannii]